MKYIIVKSMFIVKVILKNVLEHPLRSLLMGLGFFGLFIATFMTFSMHDLMYQYHVSKIEDVYQDFDMEIGLDQYSDQRFFSIRDFNESEIDAQIATYHPFFEFTVLSSSKGEQTYVDVYASSIANLEKISDRDIAIDTLLDNEVIVTHSYAKEYNLDVHDVITLYASDQQKTFVVKEIVEDQYLFSGHSVFIDKDASLAFFLASLSPSLEGFPQILLKNLYNHVYIDIDDTSTYQTLYETLQSYDDFEYLSIHEIYNEVEINKSVSKMTALFQVVLWIVFATILLVLSTTLKVFAYDRQKLRSTLHLLGAKKTSSFLMLCCELGLIILMSFLAARLATHSLIRLGYQYLGSTAQYVLSFQTLLYTLLGIIMITIITFYLHQRKFNDTKDVWLLNMSVDEKEVSIKKDILMLMVFVLIFMIERAYLEHQQFAILISVFAIVGMLYVGTNVSVYLILWLSKRFSILYMLIKKSLNKRQFYHLMMTQLTIYIVIFLLVFAVAHLNRRTDAFINETKFDFIVTSITGDIQQIYMDLDDHLLVSDITQFDQYRFVEINTNNQYIETLISIDPNVIDTYFNVDIESQVIESFQDQSIPKIILPRLYEEVHHMEVGQVLYLKINENYQGIEVEIAGFYEKEAIEIAFINLYAFDAYAPITNDQLMINTTDKTTLKSELLETYGPKMVLITDYEEEVITPLSQDMKLVRNYLIYIIIFMMGSFIISLFNHYTMMYYQEVYDDSKLHAIGFSKREIIIYLIKSQLMICIGLMLASTIIFYMFMQILPDVITLFGVYERIILTPHIVVMGLLLHLGMFSVLAVYQIVLIKKTKFMNYLSIN